MSEKPLRVPKVLRIYLEMREYPILARRIREIMRAELFARGIVAPEQFFDEVEEQAVKSQQREGISNPLYEESEVIWDERIRIITERHTDFYFAHNLPHSVFREIVENTIRGREPEREEILSFNPELAPWDLLFAQGERYENLPPNERKAVKHHLQEIIVVLIKGMISDQLAFVGIARKYFTISDLQQVLNRRIGRGKIGGKAAGMLLAWKILRKEAKEVGGLSVSSCITIPDSYYLGADAFYDFLVLNDLYEYMNQKYRDHSEIEREYPDIQKAYGQGRFPSYITRGLEKILKNIGDAPIIVRSSSLLEDNFGYSFSGKYDSYFCPNQGSFNENLAELKDAVRKVYASVLNPAALLYRSQHDLLDYDERMAVLIQKVEGKQHDSKFYPTIAGVAFSRNPYRWNTRIKAEDGFARVVVGMGTRAVDRVANDYPRMFALSHPQLRPEVSQRQIKRYSQHMVDLIDLKENAFKTVPLAEASLDQINSLRYLASIDKDDGIQPMISSRSHVPVDQLVLTLDQLASKSRFAGVLRETLGVLETHYKRPVDIEFAMDLDYSHPDLYMKLALLQCRPLSRRQDSKQHQIPTDIPKADILFTAREMVPHGSVRDIEYIIYIDPEKYSSIADNHTRYEIARAVGRLNRALEGKSFILMGPGRWGSANIALGVRVTYADIFNCRALIEIAMPHEGERPEASHGTHFFQDLVEADIYPLALYPDDEQVRFNSRFFLRSKNSLIELSPADKELSKHIRAICVPSVTKGRYMHLIMNTNQQTAIAFLG